MQHDARGVTFFLSFFFASLFLMINDGASVDDHGFEIELHIFPYQAVKIMVLFTEQRWC
jgi:hypothetical protein